MNDYQIEKIYLESESDVEQKVLYPLLTNIEPQGLGYDAAEIQTKINLKKIVIDKGTKSLSYYPDYLITVNGIPSIIIEAKTPGENLEEAFRQAALYASELNRKFEKDVNPCQLIIASDGLSLIAGFWDQATPLFNIETSNWLYSEHDFNEFLNKFSKSAVEKKALEIKSSLRKKVAFKRPLNLLGGKVVQDKPSNNSFGETISIQYRHLFNPNVEEEKIDVVRNAYVNVNKHDSHVNPIDKLIRKKILPAYIDSTEIENNTNPKEIIRAIQNAHDYNNQVLLLIGSVGSGKSTFTTYLKEVALEKEVVKKLAWLTLDLNNAPLSKQEIYLWVKNNIINQIKKQNPNVDFDSLPAIMKIYHTEITKFKNGVLQLLNSESDAYKEKLVDKIMYFQSNIDITLACYIEHFVYSHNKELIITLDNSDKRNLEEQLLMFEVANWIKDSIKAIVFLPIRDTTFDLYRNQKPLDTVVKDLIFRIIPPSLEKVLYNRISYATRLSEKNKENRFYYLPNNMKVNYPAEDELYYLKGILSSLFQNIFFKRLISGLAGGDIRVGLEIFLDFCKSGHINESEIFKMKQSKGLTKLPNYIVARVFIRGSKVYYDGVSARIKNLFHSNPNDELPDPFIRVSILKWLNDNKNVKGSSGIHGFHTAEKVMNILVSLGHNKDSVKEEILALLSQSLIINESQKKDTLDDKELISISIPGIIHLELVNNANIDYLSSCAEDTWYNNVELATTISDNMADRGQYLHLAFNNNVFHAKLLVKYLEEYYNLHFKPFSEFISDKAFFSPVDFTRLHEVIDKELPKIRTISSTLLDIGSVVTARIVSIQPNGVIVELENSNESGFVSIAENDIQSLENELNINDVVKVEIIKYNNYHRKYDLKLLRNS